MHLSQSPTSPRWGGVVRGVGQAGGEICVRLRRGGGGSACVRVGPSPAHLKPPEAAGWDTLPHPAHIALTLMESYCSHLYSRTAHTYTVILLTLMTEYPGIKAQGELAFISAYIPVVTYRHTVYVWDTINIRVNSGSSIIIIINSGSER